ncbi:MAG: hypothetical protein RIF37_14855 [Rhodospirillaceae bacterium]
MVDRSGTGVQPVPATSYLEGFVGLTDQAKANLTNENLFGSHDGEFINQNTMAELFRQARNGNAEAVSVLMHYTCHDSRQVRAFAKAHIGDLYRESPRMVGEMAGEIVEIYTSMKSKNPESTFFDTNSIAFISFLSAKYERRNGNTGDSPYGKAMDIIKAFIDANSLAIFDDAETFLASNRFVLHDELDVHANSLEKLPVEHCGVYRLDPGYNLADLIKKAGEKDQLHNGKTLIAAVQVNEHFVSVVIRGDNVCILDTRPKKDDVSAGELVKGKLETLMPGATITCVLQDLQSMREGHDQGLPNGCGIINIELHRRLSGRPKAERAQPLDKLLRGIVGEIDSLSADQEQSLNDVTRLQIFNSYVNNFANLTDDTAEKNVIPEPSTRDAMDMMGMLPVGWFKEREDQTSQPEVTIDTAG